MRASPLADAGPLACVVVTLRGARLLLNAPASTGDDDGSGCRCMRTPLYEAADTPAVDAVLATSPAGLLGLAWALGGGGDGDDDDDDDDCLAPAPPPVYATAAAVDGAAALVDEAAAVRCPLHGGDDDDDQQTSSCSTSITPDGVAVRRAAFPRARAAALLARVVRVSYHQPVALPAGGLVAVAVPAGAPGACPGDAAWRLEDGGQRGAAIVFVASGTLTPDDAAAPAAPPVDVTALAAADVLIYAPPAAPRAAAGPAWHAAVATAASAAAAAVDAGGCALVAAPADGSAFASVDAILAALDARGCGHVPVYWVSPAARAAIAAATACGEWCRGARWERVLGGRPPFALADAAAGGRLVAAASVPEAAAVRGWAAPCVAVVPPSSVTDAGGAGAALIAAWRDDPRAAFVWHGGEGGASALVRAAVGTAARVVDATPPAGATIPEAAALIAALAPSHALLPAAWEEALLSASAAGTAPPIGCSSTPWRPLADDVHVALPPRAWRATLTADLAAVAARKGGEADAWRALAAVTERDGALTLDAASVAAGAVAVGLSGEKKGGVM